MNELKPHEEVKKVMRGPLNASLEELCKHIYRYIKIVQYKERKELEANIKAEEENSQLHESRASTPGAYYESVIGNNDEEVIFTEEEFELVKEIYNNPIPYLAQLLKKVNKREKQITNTIPDIRVSLN
ncbi:hypothetical protein ABK040_016771 [Willaertia magna]